MALVYFNENIPVTTQISQALKKKCTVIEAASGNNVLDADAMDKVTERVSKCEDRLSAVEDLNRNVRIHEN